MSVRVQDLRKRYGSIDALAGVSFEAHVGEILGVLGPNGAGKTTLIEILEGLREADGGVAMVLGVAVPRDLPAIRGRLGIAMQRTALPPLLTVDEILGLYGVIFPQSASVDTLLSCVGLEERRRARVHQLSGGQLQRLAIALALIGQPEVLFLDEPTSELDPQGRRAVWDLLSREGDRSGRTVILTTHQMEEAQQLCSRVLIVDHGRILAMGPPSDLVDSYCPGRTIRFTTRRDAPFTILGLPIELERLDAGRSRVTIRTERVEPAMDEIMAARRAGTISVEDLRIERLTLEDVFLHLTGRRIRE